MAKRLIIFTTSLLSVVGFGYGLALGNYLVPLFCFSWFLASAYLLREMRYPLFRVIVHFKLLMVLSFALYFFVR